MGQAAQRRSSGYANPRANVSRRQPLVTKFKDLLVAIQFLSTSSKTSLFLVTRASRTLFFPQHVFRLCSLLLWSVLVRHVGVQPGRELTVSRYSMLNSSPYPTGLPLQWLVGPLS